MDDRTNDYIDELERKLAGKPPRKEITLPPDSIISAADVGKHMRKIWDKE